MEAYILEREQGEVRWMGETSTRFLATGALTTGAFGLVDEQAKRGESVPLHKHDGDVESFFVLEGDVTYYLGDQAGRRVSAGAFVHVPAGTVHGFRVVSERARYLILTTPRHAEFYRAITAPTRGAPIEDGAIARACAEYGIEFVGPLPD